MLGEGRRVCAKRTRDFPDPLFSLLFSLLPLLPRICYYFHPLVSLLSALVSLLFSLFSLVFPAARRLSRSKLGSAAPCLQGSRACGIQARLRQIELRGAPHLPPTPPSWPRAGQVLAQFHWPKCRPRASDGLQNAVRELPMAFRSPN